MPIRRSPRATVWRILLASLALASPAVATQAAADPACAECHGDVTVSSGAHPDTACADCHVNITSTPHDQLAPEQKLDADAICAGCHGMASKQLGKSVHAGKSCKTCHGPPHAVGSASDSESRMASVGQIKTCGKCHDEVLEGFKSSVHGEGLLKSGLTEAAPSCSDCHGSHSIQLKGDPRAKTSHEKSPEMCGSCHELVLKHWRDESTHGALWVSGKPDAAGREGPVCTTCHIDSHSVRDPTSATMRQHIPGDCGGCHQEVMKSFRDSFHGKASHLGMTSVAMCSDCHTPHQNLPASDPRASIHPDRLAETCGQCHEGEINAGFLTFDPHSDPTVPGGARTEVRWVYLFMTTLLLGVFGFFGVHDLLWLQRTLVGKLRGEFRAPHGGPGPYIRRFNRLQIWMHVTVVVSFLLLAATGLPLKFAEAWWAPQMMAILGGPQTAGQLHRFAAIMTFGYFLVHVLVMLKQTLDRRQAGSAVGAAVDGAATEGHQRPHGQREVLPLRGPASGLRSLGLLGEVRLLRRVLGRGDHRLLRTGALVPGLLHPVRARLGPERRLHHAQRRGVARNRLHLPVPLLPHAPAARGVPDGSGDLHGTHATGALQGRAAARVPAPRRLAAAREPAAFRRRTRPTCA